MFNIGDEVRVRSNGAIGVIGYVEDGYICVDLDNGAEMDFSDERSLQLFADYKTEKAAEVAVAEKSRDLTGMFNAPYVPRKGDRRLAGKVLAALNEIMPELLSVAAQKIHGFTEMDSFDKVKNFAELIGTPMVVFMGAMDMGSTDMMRLVIRKTLIENALAGTGLLYDAMMVSLQNELANKG